MDPFTENSLEGFHLVPYRAVAPKYWCSLGINEWTTALAFCHRDGDSVAIFVPRKVGAPTLLGGSKVAFGIIFKISVKRTQFGTLPASLL